VHRLEQEHLSEQTKQSEVARMLASSESLIAEMNRLHAFASRVIDRAVAADDDWLVLAEVREGRGNVETLAKLGPLGDIE
jgi:hypothetical protein